MSVSKIIKDAVLVDLDRAKSVTGKETMDYRGEMYKKPGSWTLNKLDWKQVGLLGRNVHLNEHKLFETLIKKGNTNHALHTPYPPHLTCFRKVGE